MQLIQRHNICVSQKLYHHFVLVCSTIHDSIYSIYWKKEYSIRYVELKFVKSYSLSPRILKQSFGHRVKSLICFNGMLINQYVEVLEWNHCGII